MLKKIQKHIKGFLFFLTMAGFALLACTIDPTGVLFPIVRIALIAMVIIFILFEVVKEAFKAALREYGLEQIENALNGQE